jgi:mono/diheme cytochrome c family protein
MIRPALLFRAEGRSCHVPGPECDMLVTLLVATRENTSMRNFGLLLTGLALLLLLLWVPISADTGDSAEIRRGQYLVHHVAMCIECHTPRNARGELDRTRLLQGAPVPVTSPFPNRRWAFQAPAIAGLPGWSDQEAAHLLQTGRRAGGSAPLRPMPTFRMAKEDAEAVVAYLRSLR